MPRGGCAAGRAWRLVEQPGGVWCAWPFTSFYRKLLLAQTRKAYRLRRSVNDDASKRSAAHRRAIAGSVSKIIRRSVSGFRSWHGDKLVALSLIRKQPQWRVIVESVECYVRDLPREEQAMIAQMLSRTQAKDS